MKRALRWFLLSALLASGATIALAQGDDTMSTAMSAGTMANADGMAAGMGMATGMATAGMATTTAMTTSAMTTAPTAMDASGEEASGEAAPTADTPEAPLSPAEQARRATPYAKVGDVTITVGEIEDAIATQSPFLRARYRDPEKLREFADGLVRFELLAREAEKRGFGDQEPVRRTTKQNAVQQLIRTEFDEKITPDSLPVEDVRAYYDAHMDEFSRPAMMRAAHILLPTKEQAEELRTQAARADAREFRNLARQHSVDTDTKLRGGDLRYFDEEGKPAGGREPAVNEAIVKAAFALEEVGDVSEPVEVDGNWSIVKLTGKRPAEERPFDEAAQGIRLRLWRERRQTAIEDFVAELQKAHPPVVHADRMAPIRLEAEAPTQPGMPPHGDPHGHGGPHGGDPAADIDEGSGEGIDPEAG